MEQKQQSQNQNDLKHSLNVLTLEFRYYPNVSVLVNKTNPGKIAIAEKIINGIQEAEMELYYQTNNEYTLKYYDLKTSEIITYPFHNTIEKVIEFIKLGLTSLYTPSL